MLNNANNHFYFVLNVFSINNLVSQGLILDVQYIRYLKNSVNFIAEKLSKSFYFYLRLT